MAAALAKGTTTIYSKKEIINQLNNIWQSMEMENITKIWNITGTEFKIINKKIIRLPKWEVMDDEDNLIGRDKDFVGV
jgi:hypothetical protein